MIGPRRAVLLVEGASDRRALEVLAQRRGRDLLADGVEIVDMNGAHAVRQHLTRLGPLGADLRLAGLCDAAEEPIFRRALAATGLGVASSRSEMEALGFFVCVADLEDELVRALGAEAVVDLIRGEGDLAAFRSLQRQPQWRDRAVEDQLHRFFGSGSHRKHRYARVLMAAVDLDRTPAPLDGVLAAVCG